MSDFRPVVQHPDGTALGWGAGVVVRKADSTEVPLGEVKPEDLLWLLDLPYTEVTPILREFPRYNIKLAEHEHDDIIDAALAEGLRRDLPMAVEWVKVHPFSAHAAVALRDYVDRTKDIEAEALLTAWRERAKQIPRMSQEDLRKFVLDLLGGAIYTSAHMNQYEQHNIGMVFMPLALGGLQVPEAVLPAVPPLDAAPAEPVKPGHPAKPTREDIAEKVAEPNYEEIDGKKVADLEFRERWDRAPKGSAEAYKADVEAKNAKLRAEYEAKLAEIDAGLEGALKTWAAACRKIDREHKKAITEWEVRRAAWEEENADIIALHAERDRLHDEWFREHTEQIGVIWEYLAQAGPRSINGMPMFFSCRFMHREDWQRALAAYERERERMDSLEV